MLHTLFFVLFFLMDYRGAAHTLRGGFTLGLINTCLVCVVVAWLCLHRRMAAENREASPRSRVE
jgi:hypothetical protein